MNYFQVGQSFQSYKKTFSLRFRYLYTIYSYLYLQLDLNARIMNVSFFYMMKNNFCLKINVND